MCFPGLKYSCFFFLLLSGCISPKKESKDFQSPDGYSFENPQKIKLGEDMDEISGIAFDQASNSLITINDEEGKLYQVYLNGKPPSNGKRFSKGGDYEDLCYDGKNWYALKSNGNISRIINPMTDSMRAEEFKFPKQGKYEFESIYADTQNKRLILLCKECESTDSRIPGYIFSTVNNETDSLPAFFLDLSGLTENPLKNKEVLKPSGMAMQPKTGQFFILASANKLLIITDVNGKALEAIKLDKKVFKQPEGICFTPSGDLYISNEAVNGMANILYFPYQPATQLAPSKPAIEPN